MTEETKAISLLIESLFSFNNLLGLWKADEKNERLMRLTTKARRRYFRRAKIMKEFGHKMFVPDDLEVTP